MSRLTTNSKAERVLRFLMGARNPQVRQYLQPYGFGEPKLEKAYWWCARPQVHHSIPFSKYEATRSKPVHGGFGQ